MAKKSGKSFGQKYKSILVLQILLKNTDNDHPLTASKIKDKLIELYDVEAEEHSIRRDIQELQRLYSSDNEDCFKLGERFPYKIEYDGSGERGYKVTKRPCSFSDLQLLVECIHSARFISKREEARLLLMIKEFCSRKQGELLKTEAYLIDRVKTNNSNIVKYIQIINKAIKYSHKIKFKYTKFTLRNRDEQIPRRHGDFYIVSPFKIIINEGNFYLLAYNGKKITHYRIDRMESVKETTELCEGNELYENIDMNDFTKRVFSMFCGEEKKVTIRFTNDLLDTVVDRFGAHGAMYIPDDDRHFKIIANVEVSKMFYSWICGFGKKALILHPLDVVEDFKVFIYEISQKYEC